MAKKMLIVESPAKAKTISKYLDGEFIVKSSYGHVRDLDKGNKGIDKENRFEPKYIVSPEKTKVVKELKDNARDAEEVWLATDEDREGEAIAWHLCEVLGLDAKTTKRIVFREITKPAIKGAIQEPRLVNLNVVNAQQARRVLDRLVGFELSEILWRKVKNKLSAGRVQSVAVKLIVEREREIQGFKPTPYFKVYAIFDVQGNSGNIVKLKAELKGNLESLDDAEKFLEQSKGGTYSINKIEVKPSKRKPSPPFTTSTMQQEASRKIGFGVSRTMSAAQKLYEQGHITYMRTDSTSLSDTAINAIANEVKKEFGDQYIKVRKFASKSKNAQEAHEAIRPTNAENHKIEGAPDMERLYDLIWKRAVASQMADAELEKTTVTIGVSTVDTANYVAKGEVIKFDGFLKLYNVSTDEEQGEETSGILPPLKENEVLKLDIVEAIQKYTRAPARYTEAMLVKKLEELGIGRPSTYAPTITKIMDPNRGYVTKESREGTARNYEVFTLKNDVLEKRTETEMAGATSNRLYASDIGMLKTDFLSEHFDQVMNYKFTADVEDKLDEVANGNQDWREMIEEFYEPFHGRVEKTLAEAERAKGKRVLGIDEATGHSILVQMNRYGPAAQIGTREEVGEEGKPRFANLKREQSMETITLDEVLELFKLPVILGDYKDLPVEINSGRYGPYVKYNEAFISLGRATDPLEVTMDQAIELIEAKIKEDMPVAQHKGMPITKGKGRFGPFLKWNEMYINIPKRIDPEIITEKEVLDLVMAKEEKEANRYIQNWMEEGISIQNARWGPVVKHNKLKRKYVKIPLVDGEKATPEYLKTLSLDVVKEWIEEQYPGTVKEPKKKAAKKTTAKKGTKKKAAAKKPSAKKKPAAKKAAAKKAPVVEKEPEE